MMGRLQEEQGVDGRLVFPFRLSVGVPWTFSVTVAGSTIRTGVAESPIGTVVAESIGAVVAEHIGRFRWWGVVIGSFEEGRQQLRQLESIGRRIETAAAAAASATTFPPTLLGGLDFVEHLSCLDLFFVGQTLPECLVVTTLDIGFCRDTGIQIALFQHEANHHG